MLIPFIIFLFLFISIILFIVFLINNDHINHSNRNIYNKYTKFVNEHSKAVSKIKELNKDYQFHSITLPVYSHDYDNEKLYGEVSCYDYMVYQLQFPKTRTEIMNQINNVDYNNTLYKRYLSEIEDINLGKFSIEPQNLKIEKLLEEEKRVFNKYKLQPVIDFEMTVYLRCFNMGGRFIDAKRYSYNAYDVCHAIDLLKDKNGTFYNNRSIWDSICRVERAKVSNRMRFSIYERDYYRCQICGRRFDVEYLEVDHIYPISKGGKSVYDNLQTLCRACNKEKGNKIL